MLDRDAGGFRAQLHVIGDVVEPAFDTGIEFDVLALGDQIGAIDAQALLLGLGFTVQRRQIVLNSPIKVIGLHTLPVSLHPEVDVNIIVNVARTPDEAERQARGEDLTVTRSDDEEERAEAKLAAEKFFEQTPEELKAGEEAATEEAPKA